MAKIIRRTWTSRGPTGKQVRHVAYGYTLIVNGKRERKFSSEWLTETEALNELARRQQEIGAGIEERPAERTLGEAAKEYLAYKTSTGKRSVEDDRLILEHRLLPAFGAELPLRRLNAGLIARYEKERLGQKAKTRSGTTISPSTVAKELAVLRHLLRLAVRWGYLRVAPEVIAPPKPDGRLRYLDEDEARRLVTACAAHKNRYLLPAVVIALNTGMRKSEVLGLEWERVDLSSARITLYRTKSGKPRGVPINADVYDALVTLEPDSERRRGRVFPPGNDRNGWQIRKAFEAVLKQAGIAGFTFHDLRHTAASHMVMRGASLREVQELLGHTTLAMTLRYAHLSPAHLRKAAATLEGLASVPKAGAMAQGLAQNASEEGSVSAKSRE
jgi:integrase